MTQEKSTQGTIAEFASQMARNPHTFARLEEAMLDAKARREISDRIRDLRERRGLKQPQVAERVGAQLRTYQNWEAGGGTSADNYERLAEILGVSYDFLVNGSEASPPAQDILARLDELEKSIGDIADQLSSLDARLRAADAARRSGEDRPRSRAGQRAAGDH